MLLNVLTRNRWKSLIKLLIPAVIRWRRDSRFWLLYVWFDFYDFDFMFLSLLLVFNNGHHKHYQTVLHFCVESRRLFSFYCCYIALMQALMLCCYLSSSDAMFMNVPAPNCCLTFSQFVMLNWSTYVVEDKQDFNCIHDTTEQIS